MMRIYFLGCVILAVSAGSNPSLGQGVSGGRGPGYSPRASTQPSQPSQPTQQAPPVRQPAELQSVRVAAIVGGQHILAGEVDAESNLFMAPQVLKIPAELWQRDGAKILKQMEQQRKALFKPMLNQLVQDKLLFAVYMATEIPTDKLDEATKSIKKRIDGAFPDALEAARKSLETASKERLQKLLRQNSQLMRLALIMREGDAQTLGELDRLLKRFGSSLQAQKRLFGERNLGQQLVLKQVNRTPDITHQEMLDFYYKNIKDYQVKAQARWEQLSVLFREVSDKNKAYQRLAAMGNEVVYGANFAAVAKRHSHGSTADKGGARDWTTKGSLVSQPLDDALFTLPLNRLSRIIEDSKGFHIIRIVERKEAGRIPFKEAQVEIKKDLRTKRVNSDYERAIKDLRKTVDVQILDGK